MNAQLKTIPTSPKADRLITPFYNYGGSDLEQELLRRAEVKELRAQIETLKEEKQDLEDVVEFLQNENSELTKALGDFLPQMDALARKITPPSPSQAATWNFLDEVNLSDKQLLKLGKAFSDDKVDALSEIKIKVFLAPNASKNQRQKAAELISATLTPQAQVAILDQSSLAEAKIDSVSNEFDHTIFLGCGQIDFLSKSELGELKSKLRVISGQNLNVVNVLRKIAAHRIKKEEAK